MRRVSLVPVSTEPASRGIARFARELDAARQRGLVARVNVAPDGVHPAEMAVRIDAAPAHAPRDLDTAIAIAQGTPVRIALPDNPPRDNLALLRRLDDIAGDDPPALTLPPSMLDDARCRRRLAHYRGDQSVSTSQSSSDLTGRTLSSLPRLRPVLPSRVLSGCHALGAETATTILPSSGLALPRDAATVVVEIDLREPGSNPPDVRSDLSRAIGRAVRLADACHDCMQWPTAALALDAFMNRRLAIVPRGLGDLVRSTAPRPEARADALRRLVARSVMCARQQSRLLARRFGVFPAMEADHAIATFPPGARDEWRLRWIRATAGQRYRHRHLVFVQLSDCWPSGDCSARYAELLPALRGIDGIGFGARWLELVRRHGTVALLTRVAAALR